MVECMTAMKEERYDDAIRLASDIISSTPTSKWYHIRGLAHQALGNFKDAFNDYMEADSLDPTDEIRRVLNVRGGECLEKLKDFNLFELISDSTVPPESLKNFGKNDILKARRFLDQDNLENSATTKLGNSNRFIPVRTKSASTNYTRCGVVGSFPVTGQHAEEHGPLYSRGRNVIPQGPTPLEFFRAIRVLLMQHHGVSSELANIIAMHSFVWFDFVPFTLDKEASTKGVDHENYEKLKKDCEGSVIKYINDAATQLHLTHIMVIGRHAKEFVEKHRDKLFSSEVKVYYCLHPSKMSMGASNHEVFDALTSMNEMVYDLRGEECKPINIEFMENNFQTYIRDNICGTGGSDEFVYVGERDGEPILFERSKTAFEQLLKKEGAAYTNLPNQATIQSDMTAGRATTHAGLDLKIYKFDSDDAPSLEFGAQTDEPKYHEWFKCFGTKIYIVWRMEEITDANIQLEWKQTKASDRSIIKQATINDDVKRQFANIKPLVKCTGVTRPKIKHAAEDSVEYQIGGGKCALGAINDTSLTQLCSGKFVVLQISPKDKYWPDWSLIETDQRGVTLPYQNTNCVADGYTIRKKVVSKGGKKEWRMVLVSESKIKEAGWVLACGSEKFTGLTKATTTMPVGPNETVKYISHEDDTYRVCERLSNEEAGMIKPSCLPCADAFLHQTHWGDLPVTRSKVNKGHLVAHNEELRLKNINGWEKKKKETK